MDGRKFEIARVRNCTWRDPPKLGMFQCLACVASVSSRVIARKLEREQKKSLPPPPSCFFLLSSQLSRRTRAETLAM